MRILIAEDDAALSEALRFTLSQAGYAVDHVGHGLAADEALKGDGFSLLILDLGLPKLDGLEVLRRLRKRNTTLPVLILSGREQPEEKVAGLDLGADDYLVKPFSLNELQARVRALLRRSTGVAAPTLQYGELSFDTVGRVASIAGKPLPLSLHEAGRAGSVAAPLWPRGEQGATGRATLQLRARTHPKRQSLHLRSESRRHRKLPRLARSTWPRKPFPLT